MPGPSDYASHFAPKMRGSFPTRQALALSVLAILARFYFWFATHRTWEDALITLQHAENAVRGLGLTHTPQAGPPLHGFTSPLSVLIPLCGEWLHTGFGLTLLRLVSALLGGVSVWLGMKIGWRLGLHRALIVLVGGFLAIEHHQILFGMAGMETQVAVCCLLFSVWTLFDRKPIAIGLGLGLCMLARPDFVFWVAVVAAILLRDSLQQRRATNLLRIAGVFLAVYGPWLIFTTWYYGSPVPNTILAKAYGYHNAWYHQMPPMLFVATVLFRLPHNLFGSLGPSFGGNGTGFQLFADYGIVALLVLTLAIPGGLRTIRRRDPASLGITGFFLAYSMYYMFGMDMVFGWYTVPFAAITILLCASGGSYLAERSRVSPKFLGAFVAVYLLMHAALFPITLQGERRVQEFVEDNGRKAIGEYLAGVMGPDETIGCEPLGYVGYYSRHIVFDYPGLCSRRVTSFMREHREHHNLYDMLRYFKPDYLLLRQYETVKLKADGWLDSSYEPLKSYAVPEAAVRQMLFPERNIDLRFTIYRKRQ